MNKKKKRKQKEMITKFAGLLSVTNSTFAPGKTPVLPFNSPTNQPKTREKTQMNNKKNKTNMNIPVS